MGSRLTKKLFTSSGSWTCPAGITAVFAIGAGAGGGGCGGGSGGGSGAGSGGAGGGGALQQIFYVPVVPGTTYTITIGAGGAGGTAGSSGFSGAATTFGSLAQFMGASAGGSPGVSNTAGVVAPGGANFCLSTTTSNLTSGNVYQSSSLCTSLQNGQPTVSVAAGATIVTVNGNGGMPGNGGDAGAQVSGVTSPNAGKNGYFNTSGNGTYAGGLAGSNGTSSTSLGGGSGGGGGAGPQGSGGGGGGGGGGNSGSGPATGGAGGAAGTGGNAGLQGKSITLTGNVNVTNSSTAVSQGSSPTAFTTQVAVGDYLMFPAVSNGAFKVASITNDANLVLSTNFTGTTTSNVTALDLGSNTNDSSLTGNSVGNVASFAGGGGVGGAGAANSGAGGGGGGSGGIPTSGNAKGGAGGAGGSGYLYIIYVD